MPQTSAVPASSNLLAITFSQIAHSFCHISMLLFPTVVLALEKQWHMSYGDLLVLMTVGNVLFGVAALPAGWLGDRWSTLGMMIVYFFGLGASLLLTGAMRSTFGLALGLTLVGLFASIYHPVGMSWLIRSAHNRGRILGINGVFGSLGVAVAAMIAGVLTDLISWRAAFIVPGIIVLICGVALVYCTRRGWVKESKADAKPESKPSRDAIVRAFVVLSITMMCNGLIFQSMTSAMPKIFAERIGDWTGGSAAGAGTLVSLVYFGAMAAQVIGGYLSDKVSSRTLYVAASLAQLPLYFFAASLVNSPLFFVVAATVLFNTIAVPTENVLLSRYTPDKWRATAFGAKFVLALGVGALGVPLVAHIHETTGGFYWYFVFLAAMIAIVVLAALWLPVEKKNVGRVKPAEQPSATPGFTRPT
jgi:MFS transporter, FSR family, fosmidomycin resistance protein